jgi:C1A family cysteine protease
MTRSPVSALLLLLAPLAWATPAPTYVSKQYPQEFYTGGVHTPSSVAFMRSAPRRTFVTAPAPVPSKYTMRGKTGQIENQGQCGSCWDFSLTSTLRGTWMMAGKDPGRLSFNYLLKCNSKGYSCWGGSMDAADDFVSPKGAPKYGADGEYDGSSYGCQQEPVAASATQYFMLGPKGENPSFKDIAYVVGVLHRPVSVFMEADSTFQSYVKGIYNGCPSGSSDGGNHLVVIEGYDCESSVDKAGNCVFDKNGNLPAGVGIYDVRNSWGSTWGEKGYVRMKATDDNGARCNAVASYALYYEVK